MSGKRTILDLVTPLMVADRINDPRSAYVHLSAVLREMLRTEGRDIQPTPHVREWEQREADRFADAQREGRKRPPPPDPDREGEEWKGG